MMMQEESLQQAIAGLAPENQRLVEQVSECLPMELSAFLRELTLLCNMQLGTDLALQRRQLTLLSHPLSTLWYFNSCAISSAWRALQWSSHHPVTLWCVLPLVATYAALKPSGKDTCDITLLILLLCMLVSPPV